MNAQRIVLLTAGDVLSSLALQRLARGVCRDRIAGAVIVSMKASMKLRLARRAVAAGAGWYLPYMQIETNGLMVANVCSGRPISPIESAIRRLDVPVRRTSDPNDPRAGQFIASCHADLVLSVRPGHVLRSALIASVPPIVNLHGSALPCYRGIAAVARALAAGDGELGVALHEVTDERIDGGRVVARAAVQTASGESVLWHTLRVYQRAGRLIEQFVGREAMDNGGAEERGEYFSWPDRSLRRTLRDRRVPLARRRDLTGLRRLVASENAVES